MKIFFIVNPIAGNGNALKNWELQKKIIFDKIGEHSYELTKYKGHATDIAKKVSKEDYDLIVSCGGDGTLNEVVNGVVDSNKNISALPLGTGSDFVKTIGIRSVEDFISAMKSQKIIASDVIGVTFFSNEIRYFVNILSIGFSAEVMEYVNRNKKFGKYSFMIGVFATLSRMDKFNLKIKIDQNYFEFSTIEAIFANGKYFGGGMLASPESKIDDNILDIHILKPFSKIKSATNLKSLINGTYIRKGYAHNFKAKSIEIISSGHLIEMEGEVVGKTPIKMSMNKKIGIMVP
ncbi:MAG: diacylglycerol/lipid kinase family protein [Thermoplasmata archaeon]